MTGSNFYAEVTSPEGNLEYVAFTETNGFKTNVRGTVVPTDAQAGYAKGCVFAHTDGGTGTTYYVNEGSATSCDFNATSAIGTASTLAQATTIESGTYDVALATTTQTSSAPTLTIPDFAGVSDTFVFATKSATLVNKTLNVDLNTVSNVNADELDPIAATTGTYGVPFIITAVNAGAATTTIFNANAPFKFRVIDAHAVSTKAGNAGTFKIDNGTNDITTAVSYNASDTLIARAAAIDDAYHTISGSGTLRLISSDAADAAIVYVTAIRVD